MSASFLERFGREVDANGQVQPLAKHVQLVAIGQGKPQFAAEFRETFRFAGSIFVDPSHNLYSKLHFTNNMSIPPCTCDCCLASTQQFAYGCLCKCWCPCQVGDMKQNGGILVVNDHGELLYKHIERASDDHVDPSIPLFTIPKEAGKNEKEVLMAR